MRRVIDDRQAFDDAVFRRAVEHEIHRPHLVGRHRKHERLTLPRQHLLALATAHLQLRFLVKALDALVVHEKPVLAQLQVDHPEAVATMALSERQYALAQIDVAVGLRGVAECAGAHSYDCQRPTLAQPLVDHVAHLFPPGITWRYGFVNFQVLF